MRLRDGNFLCVRCQGAGARTVRQTWPVCSACATAFDRENLIWRIIGIVLMAGAAAAVLVLAA